MSLFLGLLLALADPAQSVANMVWLSGVWVNRRDNGQWAEEYWTLPRGGMMLGAGMSGKDDRVQFFEHMRIETQRDGTIAFVSLKNGAAATVFPLVRQESAMVVFEKPDHDYPQRIVYQMKDGKVFATISNLDGSRAAIFEYRRPG